MKVLMACIIAFSTYSKLPIPNALLSKAEWTEENRKYVICFFPFVGAVVGGLCLLWFIICQRFQIGNLAFSLITALIPLIVSGGIHADGYMDTMDALHSYKNREEKLRILKDSHVGAFAVICLTAYYLTYSAGATEIDQCSQAILLALSFVLSRIGSAVGIVYLKNARQDGMLYAFSSCAHRRIVRIVLFLMLGIVTVGMLYVNLRQGALVLLSNSILYGYYCYKSKKEFGGITGDLAGWFLMLSELVSVLVIGLTG